MKHTSHKTIGALSALLFGYPIIPSYLSSTLPDIDIHWSTGKRTLLTGHRGITHHFYLLLFLLLLCVLLNIYLPKEANAVLISFLIGYMSHIIADSFTTHGIPVLKYKDRFSFNLFKTGSTGEYIFLILFVISCFTYLLYTQGLYGIIPPEIKLLFSVLKIDILHQLKV